MPPSKPNATSFWVMNLATNADFQPLSTLVVQVLGMKLPNLSIEDRSDLAEEQLEAIAQELEAARERQKAEGMEPTFELSYDAGTPYYRKLPTDAFTFLDKLLALSDREFVDFCVSLLTALGGEALNIDGPHDGGVDFVARNVPIAGGSWEGLKKTRLLVVGQAKHYRDSFVTESEMRDFVGGALKRTSDYNDNVTHRGPVLAPILFAFWTTSDFNTVAKAFANSVGIWTLNGVALAQLALRAGLRFDDTGKILSVVT